MTLFLEILPCCALRVRVEHILIFLLLILHRSQWLKKEKENKDGVI